MPPDGTTIRPITPSDSLVELTDLLHQAYARLGHMGLNYTAVDQSVEDTARRVSRGECVVARWDGRIVGTLTVRGNHSASACEFYRPAHVAHAHQFGVEPGRQGRGVGSALLAWAEAWASAKGFRELALDTAEPATHLIGFYTRRGFRPVGHVQWEGKRYRSVVLSKTLAQRL